MNNIETFNLVGKCLALDDNGFRNELIDLIEAESIDWYAFVAMASDHLVLPAVYLKFKKHGIIEFLPAELAEHLLEIYELNAERNKSILAQANEIVEVLNEANIHPVFLKGVAHLMSNLYADLGERIMSDIDFLVSDEEYFKAARMLKLHGYGEGKDFKEKEWKDVTKAKHYPRLFRQDCVADIEIHRIPVDEVYTSWFNSAMIDKEKRSLTAFSGCYVESDKHKIVHNFIHCQLINEGQLTGVVSLRDIYDLYLLSKLYPLGNTLKSIKPKAKAIAYYSFAGKTLDIRESFFFKRNFAYRRLMLKHSLVQKSTILSRIFLSAIFLLQRIVKGYIGQMLKAIYSSEKRTYISQRVTNKKWYSNHLEMYIRFFKNNVK